jgi:DNA-binding CsgD family transcriptional regulator/tetratricopeptide (TPR) repeat protein
MDGFFGRVAELGSLRGAAAGARLQGQVVVAVVEGDPGAGKSRLVAEFMAEQPHASTISVACYQPEAHLPLSLAWTLAGALDVTSHAAGSPSREVDPSGGWAGLAEALHCAVSGRAPLTIVVDDAQWCDEGSAGVLHHVARGAVSEDHPLLLVLAARPSPTVAALADAMERLPGVRSVHLRLGALDEEAALALVRSLAPDLDDEAAADLARRADGSPFWCRHLAAAADRRRPLEEVMASRLLSLSADATEVLATCVVLARPLERRDLAEIHGWTVDRVPAALSELTVPGLLVEAGSTLRFSHDLVRAAVEGALEVPARVRELVAGWMEERAGDDVAQLLAAAELRRVVGLPTGAVLRRILSSPMRRMVGVDGLQTITDLVDEVPPDDRVAVPLAEGVAVLAGELGRHRLAIERWSTVAARAERPLDRARAWLAASEEAQHLELAQEARSHLRSARQVAPDDPVLAAGLDVAEAALVRWLDHDLGRARELTERALGSARPLMASPGGSAARDLYLRALVLACVDAMQRNAADEILPLAAEIADAAAGAETRASVQARLRSGSALLLVGRLDAAERELASAWVDARRALLTDLVLDVGSWLAWTHYLRGQLTEAEEVAAACCALADRLADRTRPASMALQWRRIVAVSRGDHLDALGSLREMAAAEPDAHHRIALRLAVATWLGQLSPDGSAAEVVEQLDRARSDAAVAGCVRCRTELLLAGADALARVGASEQSAAWLDEGRRSADGGVPQRWLIVRAEASLAGTTTNDPAVVIPALDRAVALADETGMGLEAIWARLDLGRSLVDHDADRAATILRDAGVRAQSCGAVTEARLAARLLRRSGERTWHRTSQSDLAECFGGLSPREREIARLIVEGASNPEMAQTLFLSRKTIERHVSNIFVKTGVRNRTQLAARFGTGAAPPPS